MKKIMVCWCLGLLVACGDGSKPDPNRSSERLVYEHGVLESCHAKYASKIGRMPKEELEAKCDAYFKERLGYTHTEARESLKQRKIPD
jgi:hypothetical protein